MASQWISGSISDQAQRPAGPVAFQPTNVLLSSPVVKDSPCVCFGKCVSVLCVCVCMLSTRLEDGEDAKGRLTVRGRGLVEFEPQKEENHQHWPYPMPMPQLKSRPIGATWFVCLGESARIWPPKPPWLASLMDFSRRRECDRRQKGAHSAVSLCSVPFAISIILAALVAACSVAGLSVKRYPQQLQPQLQLEQLNSNNESKSQLAEDSLKSKGCRMSGEIRQTAGRMDTTQRNIAIIIIIVEPRRRGRSPAGQIRFNPIMHVIDSTSQRDGPLAENIE